MTTTTSPSGTTPRSRPGGVAREGRGRGLPGRAWALAGVGAGLASIVSIVASGAFGAVYDQRLAGDAAAIAEGMSHQVAQVMVFHTATTLSCALLVVFAAGLHRQLRARTGADSLAPGIAAGGLMLVAVAQLMGSGLTTEFVYAFGSGQLDQVVPEAVAFFGHWVNTVPWLWGGAGLTGLAVASAVFRHDSHAAWIGWTSVVLGGLSAFFLVSPLQYMAGMTGPLWLTLVASGLLLSRRERADTRP